MKVESHQNNVIYFEELNAGDPFWDCDGELLMKIHNIQSADNAVLLCSGVLCCMADVDLVTPAKVKLVDM